MMRNIALKCFVTRSFLQHVLERTSQETRTCLFNNHGKMCTIATKSFANDARRRGPLAVVDEVPVDTSKYSNVLVKLYGYDPAVITSYYHFVDQAARNMHFSVTKKFNLKTEDMKVTLANPPHFFRERNLEYNLKNHGRLIQIESVPAERADIFIWYIQKNLPAGISVDIELKKWEDFVSPPSDRTVDVG